MRNEYIGPIYQLPMRAESLHPSWKQFEEKLVRGVQGAFQTIWKAFEPIVTFFNRVGRHIVDAIKHLWQSLSPTRKRERRHYHVPYRPHKISHKRALIAQRKQYLV